MTKKEYFILLEKYDRGIITSEEEQLLHAYYNLYSLKDDGLQDLDARQRKELSDVIKEGIDLVVFSERIGRTQFKLWQFVVVAAAVIVVLSTGIWFYNLNNSSISGQLGVVAQNDILPGKNSATLTMANGKNIKLSDAKTGLVIAAEELTYNDGTAIPKHADEMPGTSKSSSNDLAVQTLTMSTPKGGQYQLILSDGTRVWMNADSKISFPSMFNGVNRKVFLEGEAYFEVHKDKSHPFIVESRGQQVEVLGTHFNVNSYLDEEMIRTTLIEGSVRVRPSARHATGLILKAGEQMENHKGEMHLTQVNAEDVVAWKSGKFSFDGEEMISIMRKVERWYNVQVVFKDDVKHVKLTGSLSRFEKVSKLLQMLENTKEVSFKLEGKTITVSKF